MAYSYPMGVRFDTRKPKTYYFISNGAGMNTQIVPSNG